MKHIIIVEPAFSCLVLIETAKRMGCYLIVLSADKEDRKLAFQYKKLIDELIVVETNVLASLEGVVKVLVKKYEICGLIPGSEYHVSITAKLAEKFSLPANPVATIDAMRNKHFLRQLLLPTEVRSVKFSAYKKGDSIEVLIDKVGLPAVVKPAALAGSLGVRYVATERELKQALNSIETLPHKQMQHDVREGVIVEEFISGDEYSVEGVISHGVVHLVSITEKFLGERPYFVETGHIVSANIDKKTTAAISDYVRAVIKALGLVCGVFHLELKYDEKGPVIIELAGRLPGDQIVTLINLAKGVDLAKLMIDAHCGEVIQALDITRKKFAAIAYFPLESHSYVEVDGEEELKSSAACVHYGRLIRPNTYVEFPNTFLGRAAYAVFCANTYEAVHFAMQEAWRTLAFREAPAIRSRL